MSPGADVVDAAVVVAWGGAAVRALAAAREPLDRVNVFPVADSDTGTNMYLTLLDAVRALPAGGAPGSGAGDLLVRLARGALVGARGNSGVILSEYLRGLALELAERPVVPGDALAAGLDRAARTARGAVARPAPGTILTAADAAARAALTAARTAPGATPGTVAAAARDGARAAALRSTGELDVLARAQVLDAGALGLVLVLGALVTAVGRAEDGHDPGGAGVSDVLGMMSGMVPVPGPSAGTGAGPEGVHEGGEFEVMYVVDGPAAPSRAPGASRAPAAATGDDALAEHLRADLARIGDSVVVVGGAGQGGSGLWQAHVHTDHPMSAVAAGRAFAADVGGPPGSASRPAGGGGLRQVRVRHLPGPGDQGAVVDARPHDHAGAGEDDGPGLVAVTTAPALVADLARAGAVVLLRDVAGPVDRAALHRVAVDARAAHVALLAGTDLPADDVEALRETLRGDGVTTLDLLPAPTDLHVAVALAAAQLVEPEPRRRVDAARSALAGVRTAQARTTGLPAAEAATVLGGLLARLLTRRAELVTVLADDDVPDAALDDLPGDSARAGAELVLLRSGRAGGAVTLAAEGPDEGRDAAEEVVA